MNRTAFYVNYKDTDLCIAVDEQSYRDTLPQAALDFIRHLRDSLDRYIATDKTYATTLTPYKASLQPLATLDSFVASRHTQCPPPQGREQKVSPCGGDLEEASPCGWELGSILRHMSEAGTQAGTGPMAAIAGAFNKALADHLKTTFHLQEIIIENGGDIYADLHDDFNIAVYANQSPLSRKVGIQIPAADFPLGICTSSGTCGHSFSFGKADAVMIVCKDVLLADAYATAIANRIQTVDDIQTVADTITDSDILSAILIKDDRLAIIGRYPLKIFK